MRNTADLTGGKPIAVGSQSISGMSVVGPLVTFYDIPEEKERYLSTLPLLFQPPHGTTGNAYNIFIYVTIHRPTQYITLKCGFSKF
jgi:hypothetical protein